MSKIFAGELIGEEIGAGIIGAEMASGVGVPLAFLEIGVLGMIYGIRHHKNKKENQRKEEENQRQQDQDRQNELERQAREQEQAQENERIRLEKEQQDAEIARQQKEQQDAELARSEEEQKQQIARQNAIDQRNQENQQDIMNALNRDMGISNQLEIDRANRLRGRFDPMDLTPGGPEFDDPLRPEYGVNNDSEINQDQAWRMPNEPGDGGGFPNNDPAGGGGGFPNNDPPGGGNNGFPNNNWGDYINNPYSKVIQELARQIAINKNREKPDPVPIQEDQQILGKDGAGTWKPEYQTEEYKQQQSDMSGDYPGKNGGGIQKKDQLVVPDYIVQNDDTHLIQNELLAILNAQGMGEQNQEMTIMQLQNLQNSIPQQVQTSGVFTNSISRF